MRLYLALILLLPLFGGTINLLVGRKLPRRVVEALACGVIWGSFAASVTALAAFRSPVKVEFASWLSDFDFRAPISLFLDPLSLSLILMITFVCGLIHLYSVAYMAEEAGYVRYFALLNLFVFAMLTLVLAENLPLLYLGWEGVGFCSYALIGFWYTEKKNADAGRKAFIVTRIGDTAFGIAIVWLFQLFSTESIVELNGMGFLMPAGVLTALGMLFLVGAMGKSAQVPLMVWLPDAMAGPTPVSALIHAATMVTAGVYLLARMLPLIGTPVVLAAIAATGALTAFFAATCALAQRDLKRLLAYSTISQIGYMILGVGAGAVSAATFHLLTHAFFKALLFLGAGCVITALHHEQDIFKMGGLRKSLPRTFWPLLAGALCLAGIPLTGGFFSKDAVLGTVWEHGGAFYGGLYALGLVTAFLTSVYTFRMMYLVFGGEDSNHPPPHPLPLTGGGEGEGEHAGTTPAPPLPVQGGGRKAVPRLMEYILFPLALLALCGGLLDLPSYLGGGLLDRFMTLKAAHAEGTAAEMLLQGLAGAVSLAGLAVAHWRYGGERRQARLAEAGTPSVLTRFLLHGWYVDDLYRLLFVRPFERLAGFFWQRVDVGIIDAGLDRLAALLGLSGERLGSWTTGRVSVYLLSFAAGLALVLVYMVWLLAG
jgi:NADH-quinone oxidoreductase subunit L